MCLAIPGKIENISEGEDSLTREAKVDFGGICKDISLAFLPEAKVGEYVIVHVGFALSVVQEEEAMEIFEHLKEIDRLEKLEEAKADSP